MILKTIFATFLMAFASIGYAQTGIVSALKPGPEWYYRADQVGFLSNSEKRSSEMMLNAISQNETISQIAPLLPKKFQLIYPLPSDLQNMFDAIHFAIIQTPTGKAICKQSTGGNLESLDEVYGLQGRLANSLSGICFNPNGSNSHRNYSASRSFGILFYDGEPPVFESWTSRFNASIIAVGSKEVSEDYIVRALIHELAIKMDAKNNLSAKENLGDLYNGEATCEVMSLLRTPSVRATFATLRALNIEQKIMKEAGFKVTNNLVGKSCQDQFLSVFSSVLDLSDAFFLESILLEDSLQNQCSEAMSKIDDLDKILDILSQTKISESGKEMSLCEYMSIPDLSNDSMTVYSNGPRPRMGDGTSNNKGSLNSKMTNQKQIFLKNLKTIKETDQRYNEKLSLKKLELGPALPKKIQPTR